MFCLSFVGITKAPEEQFGPSAGTAILTAFVSLFTKARVSRDIGMLFWRGIIGGITYCRLQQRWHSCEFDQNVHLNLQHLYLHNEWSKYCNFICVRVVSFSSIAPKYFYHQKISITHLKFWQPVGSIWALLL